MRNNGLSSSDPFSRRFFNPHYNILTGNYDANVMMMALQSRKAEAIWYDRRKGTEAMDLEETPEKKVKEFSVKNLENPGENLENLEENPDKVLEKIVTKNSEKNIEILENNDTKVSKNSFKIDQKNIENAEKHPMVNPNPDKILLGIILNQPTTRFSGFWKGRHWSALRKINGLWYDLDSYLPSPVPINDNNINGFLNQSFSCGSEAFLVFKDVLKTKEMRDDERGANELI